MNIFGVCALLQKDGLVLSISRRNKPEDIGLPGGKVDPGETPLEAILRECREEIGIEIDPKDVEAIFDRVDDTVAEDAVARCFRVRHWTGTPRTMEKGLAVRWVRPTDFLAPECVTFGSYNRSLFLHLGVPLVTAAQEAIVGLENNHRLWQEHIQKDLREHEGTTICPELSDAIFVWRLDVFRNRDHHKYSLFFLTEDLAWQDAVQQVRQQWAASGTYFDREYVGSLDEKLKTQTAKAVAESLGTHGWGFRVHMISVRCASTIGEP